MKQGLLKAMSMAVAMTLLATAAAESRASGSSESRTVQTSKTTVATHSQGVATQSEEITRPGPSTPLFVAKVVTERADFPGGRCRIARLLPHRVRAFRAFVLLPPTCYYKSIRTEAPVLDER